MTELEEKEQRNSLAVCSLGSAFVKLTSTTNLNERLLFTVSGENSVWKVFFWKPQRVPWSFSIVNSAFRNW